MAREVKVVFDVLDHTKLVYDESIQELEDALASLEKSIDTLRSEKWKTNGADEFFKSYDDSWKKDLKKHISYLKHLRDCLATAQTSFRAKYDTKL